MYWHQHTLNNEFLCIFIIFSEIRYIIFIKLVFAIVGAPGTKGNIGARDL